MATNNEYQQIQIASAEKIERNKAPADFHPRMEDGPCVYDDEIDTLSCIPAWRLFYAGGSSRLHWILAGPDGNICIVETTGWGGSYELHVPAFAGDEGGHFENAYDAFWTGEMILGVATDPEHPAAQPLRNC